MAIITNPIPLISPVTSESQVFRNLLNMSRCHVALERQTAWDQKMKMSDEDTHRPIQFGNP